MFFHPTTIRSYVTAHGKDIFQEWLDARDRKTQAIVIARIYRLAHGNPGDHKWIGEGICELRIHYGPGYRIYCAVEKNGTIILLCVGEKGTQTRDIQKARQLLIDYRRTL